MAEAKPRAAANQEAASVHGKAEWQGNAEVLFERMLAEVPEALRETFRGKLLDVALQKADGGPICKKHVVEIVHEKVPDPFKTNILKAYATMGGVDLARVEAILAQSAGGRDVIIAILHAVQAEFGYVPEEALILISQKTETPIAHLYRLVTSYRAFRLELPKPHVVEVCICSGCYVKGAGELLRFAQEKLASSGERVALRTFRGCGCCNVSPVVVVDGGVYSGERAKTKIEQMLRA
ncbi:MAG: NAD(P)H-dependent oxidoreductase subunit E [Myxococcota bacterium]|jgi:NADH:ubiquinone oxidoreductase subunit E|nr:NAD(P)H-dependent oxidoreductase subunit E [Myxococcota bacterium]